VWTDALSLHGNQSLDNNLKPLSLKVTKDLVNAFLVHILLMVLPPDLSKAAKATTTSAVIFIMLAVFSSLTALISN
jgi:hypothetical protein